MSRYSVMTEEEFLDGMDGEGTVEDYYEYLENHDEWIAEVAS